MEERKIYVEMTESEFQKFKEAVVDKKYDSHKTYVEDLNFKDTFIRFFTRLQIVVEPELFRDNSTNSDARTFKYKFLVDGRHVEVVCTEHVRSY